MTSARLYGMPEMRTPGLTIVSVMSRWRTDVLLLNAKEDPSLPPQRNADTSRAMLGHHDRLGGANASWNAVHLSAGCSQESLVKTGGAGLFYCFASQ